MYVVNECCSFFLGFFVLVVVHCMERVPRPCRVCDFPFLSFRYRLYYTCCFSYAFFCLASSEFVLLFLLFLLFSPFSYLASSQPSPNLLSFFFCPILACVIRPPFSLYMAAPPFLHIDLAETVPPERREKPGVFLQRNKIKGTVGDEIDDFRTAMEGLLIHNGLESKVDCNTMEVSYIVGSEDFMFRTRRRRKALYHKSLCSGASNGSHKLKRKLMFS